jgi:hypothetical protein
MQAKSFSEPLAWYEMQDDLQRIGARLVQFSRSQNDESSLIAARIVEGLCACMSISKDRRAGIASEMNKAGALLTRLGGHDAAALPARLAQLNLAEERLAKTVEAFIILGATDEQIAQALEMGRSCSANWGSLEILPHLGTAQERIALFSGAIAKLRERTGGTRTLDHEAVVTSCARELGNRGKLFEARRKAVKR